MAYGIKDTTLDLRQAPFKIVETISEAVVILNGMAEAARLDVLFSEHDLENDAFDIAMGRGRTFWTFSVDPIKEV